MVRSDRSDSTDRRKRGGGVVTFVHDNMEYATIPLHSKRTCDVQAIRLGTTGKICLVNVYMAPHKEKNIREAMNNDLSKVLTHLTTNRETAGDHIICTGDFNYPDVIWQPRGEAAGSLPIYLGRKTQEMGFVNIVRKFQLFQMNNTPNTRGTTLDLVLTTNPAIITVLPSSTEHCITAESRHHTPIEIQYRQSTTREAEIENVREKDTFHINMKRVRREIEATIFSVFTQTELINPLFSHVNMIMVNIRRTTDIIKSVQDKSTNKLKKQNPVDANLHPWTHTRKYRNLERQKSHLKNIFLRYPTEENRRELTNAQIKCYDEYKRLKQKYYGTLIENSSGNAKELYTMMRLQKRPKHELPIRMTVNNTVVVGEQKLILMKQHLESCFTVPIDPLPTNVFALQYEIAQIHSAYYDETKQHFWTNYESCCTEEEIRGYILSLNERKDDGPMRISARILKNCIGKLAPIVTNLVNSIFATGIVPDDWKQNYINPIPKKGDVNQIQNYRGISMQSVLPKILDKAITHRLLLHMNEQFTDAQHGFRPQRGTLTNQLEITQHIHEATLQGARVDVIYLDFSRAFDTVSHRILARKLATYGMPLSFLQVIMSFVTNRGMTLKVDGRQTEHSFRVLSSVPQGSHSAPVLFIAFTNDIVQCLNQSSVNISLYADDTKAYAIVKNRMDRQQLQRVLDNISEWSTNNELNLNPSKTVQVTYLPHTRAHRDALRNIPTTYFIGSDIIERKANTKDLGVIFDEDLNFELQVKTVQLKAMSLFAAAARFVKSVHHPPLMDKIAKTYILPILEYNAIVWDQRAVGILQPLEKILHKVSRVTLSTPFRYDHPRYINHNQRAERMRMFTLAQRRTIQRIITVKRILSGDIRTSLATKLQQLRYQSQANMRCPPIFNLPRLNPLPRKSPISIMIEETNVLRRHFSFNESDNIIRNRLKALYRPPRGRH